VHSTVATAGEDRFATFGNRLSRLFGSVSSAAGGRHRNFNAGISQSVCRNLYISQTSLSAATRQGVVKKSSFAHRIFAIVNGAADQRSGGSESYNLIARFQTFD
jgi:hypothetical protein